MEYLLQILIPISLVSVGLLYFITAIAYFFTGNKGMAFAFLCYALANAGLYFGSR